MKNILTKQTLKPSNNKRVSPALRSNKYGVIDNIRYVLRHLMRIEPISALLIPVGVASNATKKYLWSFISKLVIDFIVLEYTDIQYLSLIMIFVAVEVVAAVSDTFFSNQMFWRYTHARFEMVNEKNKKIMSMPYSMVQDPDIMDSYQRADNACCNDSDGIQGMMRTMVNFFIYMAAAAVGIIILGSFNIYIMVILICAAIMNFVIKNNIDKYTKINVSDALATWRRKHTYMQNTTMDLKVAKEIRLYDMNSFMIKKYSEINKERYEAQKKKERLSFAADAGYNVIWAFCQIILYGWIIYSAVKRKITVGNLTLYLTSMTTLFNGIIRLLDIVNKLFSQSREVEDYRKFIDIEIEEDTSGMVKTEVPEFDEYNFTFRNVSFKYPKSDNYVLYNLNLTISSGEKLAVVGLNGAGKSTMIKLLLGLYEPTQGVILLNGVDIKKYDRISYYNIFAPVFQEIPIFAFPLIENVSMNTLDNTDIKRAEYAVGLSGLSNKADSLPKGIFTELLKVISDDGVELSGGENQKLGLARAVYKNAPVIVLDEPTASMDALAESRFYRNFDKMMGGKTAIYTSHRLSASRFCSKIALFDNGKLAEYGTHESLMAAGSMYSDMFKIQAQYYHEEAGLSE